MTDYADIYFVDGRNATATIDQRPSGHQAPGRVMVNQSGHGVRTVHPYNQAPMYVSPQGPGYWPPQGPGYGPQGSLGSSLLGRISTGQLIDMVAQIFVALMPLPGAPVATSDTATDVNNLTLYQSSLASHAKRDEQVRTLGNLVSKLVG